MTTRSNDTLVFNHLLDTWRRPEAEIPESLPERVLEDLNTRITEALNNGECIVLDPKECLHHTDNSHVLGSPQIDLGQIMDAAKSTKVALNLVFIDGPTGEELHFHTSHVMGLILSGKGEFHHITPDGTEQIKEIQAGDALIIPSEIEHLFTNAQNLVYAALEFSNDEIDYQKHHQG